ncbi:cutinase family protein [Nocardia blacklockiae]|uniref:cutinase family protein n=1 Tax=Nocardia blacklockiae TaxID=480036 RepID=UPI00189441BD|nr:cutinase family protein [Nocardia blacklockiae]MBF6176058.1 cutinase family protein [Nocardia blacklockiae]
MSSNSIRTRGTRRWTPVHCWQRAATSGGAAVLALTVATVPALAQPGGGTPLGTTCPVLYVLGAQGPDETSPDTPATVDTGALGQLFAGLPTADGHLVQRAYIRYGHTDTGTELPYEQAVPDAAGQLETMATEVVARCPSTRIAVAGYGQGAAAASAFATRIGEKQSRLPADAVAAVALFANPQRPPDTSTLPGHAGQTSPSPVPGTSGNHVAAIRFDEHPTAGAGLVAAPAGPGGYGTLTGRVADFCVPGDVACDTDAGSPLAQTVNRIAAQSDLRDPISAITTAAQALAATAWKTTAGVVTEDLSGNSLDQLSYQPAKTLGQRLAEAADPATPMPGPDQALAVLFRMGAIGLNTALSVAQKVITPATIAELATVGMANPVAALGILGTALAGAVAELIPPQTALGWVNQAFDAIASTVTDDHELYQLATRTQYSTTTSRRSAYTTATATPTGAAPLTAAADWFAAAARDLADTHPTAISPSPAPMITSLPTTSSAAPQIRPGTSLTPVPGS